MPNFQATEFTQSYLDARQREGRVLSDPDVIRLPWVAPENNSAQEWRWRAQSLAFLKKRLVGLYAQKNISIVDIGCGNGWMSNQMAQIPHWQVLGIDINEPELLQAKRLFERDNLTFQRIQILDDQFPAATCDVAILAASLQYFPDLRRLMASIDRIIKPGGEVHVIDTPLYSSPAEKERARQRSVDYYTRQGVPQMSQFYFHHLITDIKALGFRPLTGGWRYFLQRKTGRLSPFVWWAKF